MTPGADITIAELRDHLDRVADMMMRDGAVYAPIFERLERMIAEREQQNDPMARARRLVEARRAAA